MTIHSIRLLMLVAILAVVAACGGGSGSATDSAVAEQTAIAETETDAPAEAEEVVEPGTRLNACEIVTADDVRAATGVDAVADGAFEANPTVLSPGHSECRYEGDFGGIIVALTPEDGENLYDAAEGAYKDAKVMPGIGDGAFYSADNNRAFAWKGKVTLMFTIFLNGDLDAETVSADLSRLAFDKI